MSEKLTRIRLPNGDHPHVGLMDWGEHTAEEMINRIRDYANRLRAELATIDAARDDQFQIDIIKGPIVERHVRTLQEARK